jgi:VCBS repeat-containing protein
VVKIIRHDLEFILKQIQIAEAHAAGGDLAALVAQAGSLENATGTAPPQAGLLPYGLRTVDGSYNNLVPGRELWGASDQPFGQLLDPNFLNENDGDSIQFGPSTTLGNNDYGSPLLRDVADADPRIISNLIVDQTLENPAAIHAALAHAGVTGAAIASALAEIQTAYTAVKTATDEAKASAQATLNVVLAEHGVEMDGATVVIPNVAPDEGLSSPFNGWMTLFGQFFDHGLDLVTKGGNGTVYIPLQHDDPLYDKGADGIAGTQDDGHTNFMVLTRVSENPINTTTPWVDQNQTYGSHASKQVFMREYKLIDGKPVATGHLLEGSKGGLATWADVKEQAQTILGIKLTDLDVGKIPLVAADAYGNFIPGANGFPQLVVGLGTDGILGTADDVLIEGNPGEPVDPSVVGAARTAHAFLDDIAHNAAPGGVYDHDGNYMTPMIPISADADATAGNNIGTDSRGNKVAYDNELLDAHYITGDGRGNENIGLTAVHHVFHSEHNRIVEQTKQIALDSNDLAFLNEWLLVDVTEMPTTDIEKANLVWDGERLFQAGRFVTEMEYQHLVFEEFGRKIQPDIDVFVFEPSIDINPAIVGEFAHVVYRFGHSMLTEEVARIRMDADGKPIHDDIGLIEAFLNPLAFENYGGSADEAAGAIIRGMTRQTGNEIDEFVTGALRNNLLGLPLDLATINIARGRDVGMPSLNEARSTFFEATQDTQLKPYDNWVDFALNIKHPESVINFIAAYGQHATLISATTIEEKRAAATLLVMGGTGEPEDRVDFLNSTGTWANQETGLNLVDFWIGGLAEKKMAFGGMLGSTFSFVFQMTMENLQDADRFYYLSRTQGLNLLNELENNSFAKLAMLNSDLGNEGATGLPGDVFSSFGIMLEMDQSKQIGADPQHDNATLEAVSSLVVRKDTDDDGDADYIAYRGLDHVVINGTAEDDTIIAGGGDDAVWGHGGDDYLEAGYGVDKIHGGEGNDIIVNAGTDIGETDMLHGEDGNDVIHGGSGLALIFGGDGSDFIVTGPDGKEAFGGTGNDFILGGSGGDFLLGNEGDDWLEGGERFETLAGENSELFFNSSIIGHDVLNGGSGDVDYDAESGDDILFQGQGIQRNNGMAGFDWAIHKGDPLAADSDLGIPIFVNQEQFILRDRFDLVEGLSGWVNDDKLTGRDKVVGARDEATGGAAIPGEDAPLESYSNALLEKNVNLINGLRELFGHKTWDTSDPLAVVMNTADGSDILLGGGGSDTLRGNGGDDVIDGDKWLNVRISVRDKSDHSKELFSVDSLTEIASRMFTREITTDQLVIVREILNGGADGDIDTAVLSGNRSDYTATLLDATTLRLVDNRGIDSTEQGDIISGVENFQFADGTQSFRELVNRPPMISTNNGAPVTLQVDENTAADSMVIQLAANDPDVADALAWSITSGNEGGLFAIDAETGLISLTASPDYEELVASGATSHALMVTVSDGLLSDTQQITINIVDVNEAPVVVATEAALATEDGTVVTIDALAGASDPDAGATLSVVDMPETLPGGVSYDAATHSLTLDPTDAAYQYLAAGQTETVTVGYSVSDGTLKTAAEASWVVTGVNDVALISGIVDGSLTEDAATNTVAGILTVTDPDTDEASFAAPTDEALAGTYGTFDFNALTGAWTYTLDNSRDVVQRLAKGETATDTLTLASVDASASQTISISILGVDNEAVPDRHDLNGDAVFDILWRVSDGSVAIWELDGTVNPTSTVMSANPGNAWQIAGISDFGGDGRSDILWRHADGSVATWQMDGAVILDAAMVNANPGNNWQIAGTGDFSGDGKSDILWRHADGSVATWQMDGAVISDAAVVNANPGNSWQVAGTGDFDGDGRSDILWRHADGSVATWQMDGAAILGAAVVNANPGNSWQVAGTGDFDSDGKSDILWQHTNGSVAIWRMDGSTIAEGVVIGTTPGTGWKVEGVGDATGDGKSDILWWQQDETVTVWEMDGAVIATVTLLEEIAAADWQMV